MVCGDETTYVYVNEVHDNETLVAWRACIGMAKAGTLFGGGIDGMWV